MLLAIDPGRDTGWAIFHNRVLFACGLGNPSDSERHHLDRIDRVLIESQRIYPRSQGGYAPPNDIVTLARDAGEWGGRYLGHGFDRKNVNYVLPAQWIGGSVSKEINHPRILAKLDPQEQTTLTLALVDIAPSKRHNCYDAIGIGLYGVGRGGRGGGRGAWDA